MQGYQAMLSASEDTILSDRGEESVSVRSVVAALFQKHSFGVAYFDSQSMQIRILEDLAEYDSLLVLSQRKYDISSSLN